MAWTIEFSKGGADALERVDRSIARRIVLYLETRVAPAANPEQSGAALRGDRSGLWRYRVGDYRIICHIDHSRRTITVLGLGHRRNVYG